MMESLEQTLTVYNYWLERQPLAPKTHAAYRLQIRQYGAYLALHPLILDDSLYTPLACDCAIRDYKIYRKIERQVKSTSVNLALAALDYFHQFIENAWKQHAAIAYLSLRIVRTLWSNQK